MQEQKEGGKRGERGKDSGVTTPTPYVSGLLLAHSLTHKLWCGGWQLGGAMFLTSPSPWSCGQCNSPSTPQGDAHPAPLWAICKLFIAY